MRNGKSGRAVGELLQGTLDMLILQTLARGSAHGNGIGQMIEQMSGNALAVGAGSLYPALYRLKSRGLVSAKWGVSENNRKAKFYLLTSSGRRRLEAERSRWRQMVRAVGIVLGEQ